MEPKALQEIFDNIQQGKVYGRYFAYALPSFEIYLFLHASDNRIVWQRYGMGSENNTIEDLDQILRKVFRSSAMDFLKDFEVFDEETFSQWEKIAAEQNTNAYREWRSKP